MYIVNSMLVKNKDNFVILDQIKDWKVPLRTGHHAF